MSLTITERRFLEHRRYEGRNARRPPFLAFLRDFALSLPAFQVRRQRLILDGDFVSVRADALRPDGPLARTTALLAAGAARFGAWPRTQEPSRHRPSGGLTKAS